MFIDHQTISDPPAHVQPAAAPDFDQQFERARALVSAGQLDMALAAYDALLARSPGNADVLLARGIVHTRMEHWGAAEADLTAAARRAPNYADVWSALGNMYLWSGQPAKAAAAYDHLIALQPNDPAPRIARARAYRALGRSADARADLAQARALGASVAPEEEIPAAVASAAAQGAVAPAGYRWGTSLSTGWTDPGSGPRWNDQAFSLRRYGERGSLAFETLRAHRFGQEDYAWALDAYAGLWQGAYANLRYQRAPASRLFPANSGRAEVYQSLGHGWEASVSDDVLAFPASRVNIYGVTLAKYAGNFYVQLRQQSIVAPGSRGAGERLLGRYYYAGDADNYVEAAVNAGRSDDANTLIGGRSHSGGASLAWVRYWSPVWGTRVGASFSRANGNGDERGVTFALYRRW